MTKTFRPWDVDQAWLLPASVDDFVPPEHPAHLVREIVRGELDLTPILSLYDEERGQPPYHPAMMVALLLYAYSRGMYSSRQIAHGCEERLDFQAVTALNRPDFRTISDFRKRHLEALAGLFRQVLMLCRRAGLVGFGHVALDGTKIKANASKHKAMSYARMGKAEAELAAEIAAWLARAAAADASEDAAYGSARRGEEPPEWMRDKQRRLARIRAAKAELEAEAKLAADSRVMIGRDGFIQAYNAQAAVDGSRQIILAHRLSNNPDDHAALVPLVETVKANTGRKPVEISGDAGFCSHDNLAALHQRKIRPYLATGRAGHPVGEPLNSRGGPLVQAMRAKLKRAGRRSRYRLRKQVVEPVFGQIKQARGFRQFLLRGIDKVTAEWALICTAHNLKSEIELAFTASHAIATRHGTATQSPKPLLGQAPSGRYSRRGSRSLAPADKTIRSPDRPGCR
jgi:transposase